MERCPVFIFKIKIKCITLLYQYLTPREYFRRGSVFRQALQHAKGSFSTYAYELKLHLGHFCIFHKCSMLARGILITKCAFVVSVEHKLRNYTSRYEVSKEPKLPLACESMLAQRHCLSQHNLFPLDNSNNITTIKSTLVL